MLFELSCPTRQTKIEFVSFLLALDVQYLYSGGPFFRTLVDFAWTNIDLLRTVYIKSLLSNAIGVL